MVFILRNGMQSLNFHTNSLHDALFLSQNWQPLPLIVPLEIIIKLRTGTIKLSVLINIMPKKN